jgi:hypothetical protein
VDRAGVREDAGRLSASARGEHGAQPRPGRLERGFEAIQGGRSAALLERGGEVRDADGADVAGAALQAVGEPADLVALAGGFGGAWRSTARC